LHRKKELKKVRLEYDFAGIKTGQMMFVGTPPILDSCIRSIPFGSLRTVKVVRNELARRNKCDATCPVSTAMLIPMVAEAAIEEIVEGKVPSEVAPFWRAPTASDKIIGKLLVDPEWVDAQCELEQRVSAQALRIA